MKPKTIATNTSHLKQLINIEIGTNGYACDLNHIDVSQIEDMSALFINSKFTGDISQWNVSQVKDMHKMFGSSQFNGDISQWNVSNVTNMSHMFAGAIFRGDISNWDVRNVTNMSYMFSESIFDNEISHWKPLKLLSLENIFDPWVSSIAYWAKIEDNEKRNIAINHYQIMKHLEKKLVYNENDKSKKNKI